MNTSNRKSTWFAGGLAAVTALLTVPIQAAPTGYAVNSADQVIRTGFGECLHTQRWTPELRIPECGGQKVAVETTAVIEPAEQAAFEPQPLETLTLDVRTLFGFDKATLRPEAREKLDELTQRVSGQAEVLYINVTGHADRIGDQDYNRKLSQQRAAAVSEYLQSKTDLRGSKFEVQGVGESQPVVECGPTGSSEALIDCLEPNRRVEIEVAVQQPANMR